MIIVEIRRAPGITELKRKREFKDVKDLILVLSVILPIVFGFVFLCQLLDRGAGFLIYWACAYSWLLIFTYANCRKKDRRTGKR